MSLFFIFQSILQVIFFDICYSSSKFVFVTGGINPIRSGESSEAEKSAVDSRQEFSRPDRVPWVPQQVLQVFHILIRHLIN